MKTLTTKQASEILGLERKHFNDLVKKGIIPEPIRKERMRSNALMNIYSKNAILDCKNRLKAYKKTINNKRVDFVESTASIVFKGFLSNHVRAISL